MDLFLFLLLRKKLPSLPEKHSKQDATVQEAEITPSLSVLVMVMWWCFNVFAYKLGDENNRGPKKLLSYIACVRGL
jgi:hypothetical protein